MDLKDQSSLTVGDILDQLIKSPVTKSSTTPALQARPSLPSPSLFTKGPGDDIKLPQLGKETTQVSQPLVGYPGQESDQGSLPKRPSEIKLSIRTMATDLARLKGGGDLSGGIEIQKKIILKSPPTPEENLLPKISELQPLPQGEPLVRPTLPRGLPALPEMPKLPKTDLPFLGGKPPIIPDRPAHIHEEFKIADKDGLPLFPGAPIPKKKIPRPQDERVEYGAIARVVSGGMTTGIVTTIVVAVAIYFLLSLFVFKDDEVILGTPTPVPTKESPLPEVNELDTIFGGISVTTFTVSANSEGATSALRSFMESQALATKEFKRVNFVLSTPQVKAKPTLPEVLGGLNIRYSAELKSYMKENNLVLLYGQEELFEENGQSPKDKRLVFIVEVSDITKVMEIMKAWEETMAVDLKNLLDLDLSKSATTTFLDNERQGVKIRYRNFSLPDKSIDYSIVSSLAGRHYLIITNSRESMYSPTDRIRGL